MKIFTPCWGEKHKNLLKKALGKSLSWPKNKKAVEGATWYVTTDSESSFQELEPIYHGINGGKVVKFIRPEVTKPGNRVLLETILLTMEACLKDNEPLLMATPDFIYGDGTIDAFKKMAGTKDTVSIAHMRVHPSILDEIEGPIKNCWLMQHGFENAHVSWKTSEVTADPGSTFIGGISWTALALNHALVRHFLPTPLFVNFIPTDTVYFKARHAHPLEQTFAVWDHIWPTKLIQEKRLRFIGSSDAALMLEVTEPHANVPPLNPPGKTQRDGFVHQQVHNNIQGQFVSSFRGVTD